MTSDSAALLPWKKAKELLLILGRSDGGAQIRTPLSAPLWEGLGGSERDRVEALLHVVNDPTDTISAQRREALRAFLNERVTIREREAATFADREKSAARDGVSSRRLPHRTAALNEAADHLPALLNGRVYKSLYFENVGTPKTRRGRLPNGTMVDVVLEGRGGGLAVTEYVHCDSPETDLNYALALVLDKNRAFGLALCRCHAPGCVRFWLLPESKGPGKPARNFCPLHADQRETLSAAERKRRQRRLGASANTANRK